jgi:hypothetical protein
VTLSTLYVSFLTIYHITLPHPYLYPFSTLEELPPHLLLLAYAVVYKYYQVVCGLIISHSQPHQPLGPCHPHQALYLYIINKNINAYLILGVASYVVD